MKKRYPVSEKEKERLRQSTKPEDEKQKPSEEEKPQQTSRRTKSARRLTYKEKAEEGLLNAIEEA